MSIDIGLIGQLDTAVAAEASELMRVAFKMAPDFGAHNIMRTTVSPIADKSAIAFAARDGDRLVGFNAFIPFALRKGAERAIAYQSCWSATHPDYQGRGIWASVMNQAKSMLTDEALFICGLPNPNSHPIMVRKLGYREVSVVHSLIPAVPGLASRWLRTRRLRTPTGWVPDEPAIAATKRLATDLIEIRSGTGYVWGKRVAGRWKRLPVTMLQVGGISIGEDPVCLGSLVDGLARSRASMIHIVLSASHELAPALRNVKPMSGVRPFVVLDLQTEPTEPLNIMYGITDVF